MSKSQTETKLFPTKHAIAFAVQQLEQHKRALVSQQDKVDKAYQAAVHGNMQGERDRQVAELIREFTAIQKGINAIAAQISVLNHQYHKAPDDMISKATDEELTRVGDKNWSVGWYAGWESCRESVLELLKERTADLALTVVPDKAPSVDDEDMESTPAFTPSGQATGVTLGQLRGDRAREVLPPEEVLRRTVGDFHHPLTPSQQSVLGTEEEQLELNLETDYPAQLEVANARIEELELVMDNIAKYSGFNDDACTMSSEARRVMFWEGYGDE